MQGNFKMAKETQVEGHWHNWKPGGRLWKGKEGKSALAESKRLKEREGEGGLISGADLVLGLQAEFEKLTFLTSDGK